MGSFSPLAQQAALEEQHVGIFAAAGEQQQIGQGTAHAGIWHGDRIQHHELPIEHFDHEA